ncbi:MAG: hypothetical protein A2Y12_16170 [Planctomycetes bacterium GWF2_42_9]|nr:MAG: hypothetical protein A2Y12_16170 [Planctomycetes bacterium GWF2_42_9]HAL44932.1 hypothetical protein [Phycisphaerales bacterium]
MQTEKNEPQNRSKVSIKKVILWMLFFIILFLLIPFFGIPLWLSSESGKNMILSKVNKSVPGELKISDLSMSWFTGVKVSQLDFSDDSGCTKITAKEFSARPRYLELIAGRISIDAARLEEPQISMDITGDCAPEIQKEKSIKIDQPNDIEEEKQSPAALLAVSNIDLTIRNGDFKIIAPGSSNDIKTLELKSINSTLALRPLGKESSFDLSLAVASDNEVSQVNTTGAIKTSEKGWSFQDTSGQFSVKIDQLNLATLGPLFKVLDVNVSAAGTLNADLDTKITKGQFDILKGKVNATDLDVTGDILKGDHIQTAKLVSDVNLNTDKDSVNISNLKIETDGLTADVKGTIPKTMTSWQDFLKADSPDYLHAKFDCDVAKTFKQVKTIAKFKQNFDINYGRLSGDIDTQALNGKRMLTGNVKLWALEGKFPVKKIVLSKPVEVDAKIISEQDKIIVDKLALDSAFAKADFSGTTDNMNYNAKIDLAKMQSDVGQFIEFKQALFGDVNLAGKAAFTKGVFSSTGNGSVKNFNMVMPDGKQILEPTAAAKYDYTADFNTKLLTIRSADVTASPGKFTLKQSQVPLDSKSNQQTNIVGNVALDLSKTKQYLNAFTSFDPKAQLAGSAQGDITLGMKGDVVTASTKQIAIKGLSLAYPGQQTFTQEYMNIGFNGRFDTANKTSTIEQLTIDSPQIKLNGNLSNEEVGQNVKTEGNFKAAYSLAAVTSLIQPFMPEGLSATGNRNDSISFSSTYPKQQPALFKSNLNAKGTFGFDTAKYMGFDIGKTDFNLAVNKGLMTIAPFTTTINQGKLNFAADADFKSTPSMLKTPKAMKVLDNIQINKQTTDTLLRYVNPLFSNLLDVSGKLNFDCNAMSFPLEKGYQNKIYVVGALEITDLRLSNSGLFDQILKATGGGSGGLMTISRTPFIVKDGIVSYDRMDVSFGNKTITFSGQIGLDERMNMKVTLPYSFGGGKTTTLPLKGTLSKPEIDLGSLLQEQLKEQLQNQFKDQLQNIFK